MTTPRLLAFTLALILALTLACDEAPTHSSGEALGMLPDAGVDGGIDADVDESDVRLIGLPGGPKVTLTSPVDGDTVVGRVEVSAEADEDAVRVDFYVDGTRGYVDEEAPFAFGWDSNLASSDTAEITALAFDASGRVGDPSTVVVTVDNGAFDDAVAPEVELLTPLSGDRVRGEVVLTAFARDDRGVTSVTFFVDGASVFEDATAPFEHRWDTTALDEGEIALTAQATDGAGNVGMSQEVVVEVDNIDGRPPLVNVRAPVDGARVEGVVEVVVDAFDDVEVARVEVLIDDEVVAELSAAPYTYVWDTVATEDGSHSIAARVYDTSDNVAEDDDTAVIVANTLNVAPTLSLDAPVDGSVVAGIVEVEVFAAGVDAVALHVDGAEVAVDEEAPFGFSWDSASVSDGLHALMAVAVEDPAVTSEAVGVEVVNMDTLPPSVNLTAPVTGETVSGVVSLSAEASDNVGVARVEFFVDDVSLGEDVEAPFAMDWDTSTVADGLHALKVTAYDLSGHPTTDDDTTVTVANASDSTPPTVDIVSPLDGGVVDGLVNVEIAASDDVGVVRVDLYVDGVLVGSDTSVPFAVVWDAAVVGVGTYALRVDAVDAAGNISTDDDTAVTVAALTLPPDPASVAPPIDGSVSTSPFEANAFLITNDPPIQTGADPDALDPRRVGTIRGRVEDRAGLPVAGVVVRIHDRPEFGYTLTREDGVFDLMVNGGGALTVEYLKSGHPTVHRRVRPGWQEIFNAPLVVMVPHEAHTRRVILDGVPYYQVVRGPVVTDAAGARQTRLLFPPGAIASWRRASGGIERVVRLNVRSTEFSVGPKGPLTLPAALPPTSGYLWSAELSVDEVGEDVALGLDEPARLYMENVYGFEAGSVVPVGFYDREEAIWRSSKNGVVMELVGFTGNLALLDIDGSGEPAEPADLLAMGIDELERQQLAQEYEVGQSLFRVPVERFGPLAIAWPAGATPGSEEPPHPGAEVESVEEGRCAPVEGVDPQRRAFAARVEVAGTPHALHYRSDLVDGHTAARRLRIPLIGDAVPAGLKRIELKVSVMGQELGGSYPATPDQVADIVWDGLDVYGRPVQGQQRVDIALGYVYDNVFYAPIATTAWSFRQTSATGEIVGAGGHYEVTLWKDAEALIGSFDAREGGLGGWTFGAHHRYDANGRTLYRGDGGRRHAGSLEPQATAGAGTGEYGPPLGDGGPADEARLGSVYHMATAPDGTLYIGVIGDCQVRRVLVDGTIEHFAGVGCVGYEGREASDGKPAKDAVIGNLQSLDIDSEGNVYITDELVIRKIDTNGIITLFAGAYGDYDGGFFYEDYVGHIPDRHRLDMRFAWAVDVHVGPDDAVYVADYWLFRLFRIGTDGLVTTVSGGLDTWNVPFEEGNPAINGITIDFPIAVDVAPNGVVVFGDFSCAIRRVRTDGFIQTVAGIAYSAPDGYCATSTEPEAALDARIIDPYGYAFGDNGEMYYAELNGSCIRVLTGDGYMKNFAGVCDDFGRTSDMIGIPGPASRALFNAPWDVVRSPDGDVYAGELQSIVWRISPYMPRRGLGEMAVASKDGAQAFVFDATGLHLRTVDARSGAVVRAFGYDDARRLITITDMDGEATTIERAADGTPTGVRSPDGALTTLEFDASGDLSRIIDPTGVAHVATTTAGGLLTRFERPGGGVDVLGWDALTGKLERAEDGAGVGVDLVTTPVDDGVEISVIGDGGDTRVYRTERLFADEGVRTLNSGAAGASTDATFDRDATASMSLSDGTTLSMASTADPVWGMQTMTSGALEINVPTGPTMVATLTRDSVLEDKQDDLSLSFLSEELEINGQSYYLRHDPSAGFRRVVTPSGLSFGAHLDPSGRVVERAAPGLFAREVIHDERGRVVAEVVGEGDQARVAARVYGADGYVETVTDALDREEGRLWDAAGRLTSRRLPGDVLYGFTWEDGALTQVAPPGRAAHVYTYAGGGVATSIAPDAGSGSTTTTFTTSGGRLAGVLWSDGVASSVLWDGAGRLEAIQSPPGSDVIRVERDLDTGHLARVLAPEVDLDLTHTGPLLTSERWSGAVTGTVNRTFNNDMRLSNVNAAGASINMTWSTDGVLTQVGPLSLTPDPATGLYTSLAVGSLTTALALNGHGELTDQVTAGQMELSGAEYDGLGRLASYDLSLEGGAAESIRVTRHDRGGVLETFVDDALVRAFDYDARGNLTSVTEGAGAPTLATYDARDRITTLGARSYTWDDARDTLLSTSEGGDTTSYTHDVLQNLTQVITPSGDQVDYIYDGYNRRVGKRVGGALTSGLLYLDGFYPIAELDGAGGRVSVFYYGSGDGVPDAMNRAGVNYRILKDPFGSVRLVVHSGTGVVAQRIDYDARGRVLLDTNPGFQPFGFAGGLYDPDTGLVRIGRRDYDAEAARFIAPDPAGLSVTTTNVYTFFPTPYKITPASHPARRTFDAVYRLFEEHDVLEGASCAPGDRPPPLPDQSPTRLSLLPTLYPLTNEVAP